MSANANEALVAKHIARHKVKKPLNPLDKKIPENPKYKNVKATIDTGASLTKYLNKIEEIKTNYKFRKDEIFKRMKISTFVQLVVQVHRLSQFEPPDDNLSVAGSSVVDERGDRAQGNGNTANGRGIPKNRNSGVAGQDNDDVDYDNDDMGDEWPDSVRSGVVDTTGGSSGQPHHAPSLILSDGDFGDRRSTVSEPESSRSTLLSVARGIGEIDIRNQQVQPAVSESNTTLSCPYLLLDVRDKDDYDQCHIIPALSYSKAYLSRAANYESREMLQYKNKEGRIIVLYDDDEKIAPLAATTLVQRGYDNLFMLSGGLKVASKVFPEGLITGTLPFSVTGSRPKDVKMAVQSHLSEEDINRLEIYLDRVLQESSSRPGSKTSSVAGSVRSSRAPSITSSRASTISDRPAFRP